MLASQRFELVARLGSGATGEVYEAIDHATHRRVALKILSTPSPRGILRFKHEFRVARTISHPGLVELFELHGDGSRWFFTMELVDGCDFLEHVRPIVGSGGRALDVVRLRACLGQLTDVVDAIHTAGLVHRDIKPSNIRITPAGRLVLLDFGMASSEDETLDDGAIIGTTEYMAPEQAASRPLGPPADWYSVGAVLYHGLVGRPPFVGAGVDVLLRKQHEVPVSPMAMDATVPEDLARLAMALLATDPRLRPTPHTIVQGLSRAPRATGSASLGRPGSFVGRAAELDALGDALRRSAAGTSMVVISGASGIGKSTLAHHFADLAAAHDGAVTLRARCHERETISGGGIDGLVDSLARHLRRHGELVPAILPRRAQLLAQAFPVLRTVDGFTRGPRADDALVDPFTRRARLVSALRELMGRLGDRTRLVIVLDDVQWADAETTSLLESLLEPPDAPSMLLIATWRPATAGDAMPAMLSAAQHLALSPLDHASTATLAAELYARSATSTVTAIDASSLAHESGGYPLLLDALIQRALAGAPGGGSAISLRDAISARLDALDPVSRQVFDAVVIAGVPVDDDLLARATAAPPVGVVRALSTLRILQLTRPTRAQERICVEPFHDQIRAIGHELIAPDRRRELHAAFANALEGRGNPDPDRLVAHLEAAGETAAAAHHACEAADVAARALSFHRAVHLYDVSIRLSPGGRAHLRRLHRARAEALAAAGRGADAAADYLACLDGAAPSERLELQRQAAQQLLVTGHTAAGLATLREVLDAEGLSYPRSARRAIASIAWRRLRLALRGRRMKSRDATEIPPRVLTRIDVCWHVALGLSIVDTMRGHAFHVLGILLALRAGESRRLGRALSLEIAYRGTKGLPVKAEVEALFELAHRTAIEKQDAHALGLAIGCRGVAAFLRGDWSDGARWCQEAEVIFEERCRGVPWELATAKLFGVRSLLAMGDVTGLAARTDQVIRDCRGRGDLYGETSLRAAVLPFVHLLRGDRAMAAAEADHSLDAWSPVGYQMQHYYQLVSRASVLLYGEEPERGLALVEEAWPSITRAMLLRVQLIRVTLYDLRARLHVGAARRAPDPRAHLARATRLAEKLEDEAPAWTAPLAQTIRGAVTSLTGDGDRALFALRAAVDAFERAQMALHAAAVRDRLGTLVGGDEGRALLARTRQWFADHHVESHERIVALFNGG